LQGNVNYDSISGSSDLTFNTGISGTLYYYYSTSDMMGAGISGNMFVNGSPLGVINGTNSNSGSMSITSGQSVVFTFLSTSSMSSYYFSVYIV
jgi:hypothetical protein